MSDIQDQFRELERIKRREQRKQDSPVTSWKDKAGAKEYLAHLRRVEREELLPLDRKCPRCGRVELRPRAWVVLVNGRSDPRWRVKLHLWKKRRHLEILRSGIVPERKSPFSSICRSCYSMEPSGSPTRFLEKLIFWKVNPKTLKVARSQRNLTGTQVAEACGWSQAKQSKIESHNTRILSDDDVHQLMRVLEIDCREEIVHRFRLEGDSLKKARRACGVSRTFLASKLGVSVSRIRSLESSTSVIEERIAEALTSALAGIESGGD